MPNKPHIHAVPESCIEEAINLLVEHMKRPVGMADEAFFMMQSAYRQMLEDVIPVSLQTLDDLLRSLMDGAYPV